MDSPHHDLGEIFPTCLNETPRGKEGLGYTSTEFTSPPRNEKELYRRQNLLMDFRHRFKQMAAPLSSAQANRVVTEEREVTDGAENIDVPRIEMVPGVITEDVGEKIIVPVVREVPVTRMVEEPTGRVVTGMVEEAENIDVPPIEMVPGVITEDVEEKIIVPVVTEVPVARMVEEPTGS